MIDKVEPPAVADGYGLSVAFVCMLDIVKSIQTIVQPVADTTIAPSDVPSSGPSPESASTSDTGIAVLLWYWYHGASIKGSVPTQLPAPLRQPRTNLSNSASPTI